jgi:hypothetical protein
VSVLRRSHDHHRDIPARRLAAHPAGGIPNRDPNRYVMIRLASRQYPGASLPLRRRLSTGNDHARRHTALNIRLVDQSPLRAAAGKLTASHFRPIRLDKRHKAACATRRRSAIEAVGRTLRDTHTRGS